jgi:hypothetical protein
LPNTFLSYRFPAVDANIVQVGGAGGGGLIVDGAAGCCSIGFWEKENVERSTSNVES